MRSLSRTILGITVLALGACGISTQSGPTIAGEKAVPFQLLDPTAATLVPAADGPGSEPVTLCFVQDHNLVAVQRQLASPVTLPDVVRALAEPPQESANLRTAFGGETLVHDVQLQSGVVRVDLDPSVADLGGDNQLLAVGQLVCSLTARPGVGQVAFTLAGAPVDVPRADGTLTLNPVSRDDYASLMNAGG